MKTMKTMTNKTQPSVSSLLKEGHMLTPATLAVKMTCDEPDPWIPAKHLLYISTLISKAIAKGKARIMVTMPPRHGKSEFLSVRTPIWFLERYPQKRVMLLSYGSDLASSFSLKVRNIFAEEKYQQILNTRLNPTRTRSDSFLTTQNGGMEAAGLRGVITGRGADLLLVDDYIKNAEESLSDTQLNAKYEWFRSTAFTRLEPGASLIILATRWAKDDLIGRLLEDMPERWTLINLPAFAKENDPLNRAPGEPLWPERYGKPELDVIRNALGSYWWEAEYQQDPPMSMGEMQIGGKIKTISHDELPHDSETHRTVRAWDLAGTSGQKSDYTVGAKLLIEKNTERVIITEIIRFKGTPKQVQARILATAERDGRGTEIWMEKEPGSAGEHLVATYKEDVLNGFVFNGERATGPIEVRVSPFLAACEGYRVSMVEAPWNQGLREEVDAFPEGKHDDQLVACALAYHKLARRGKRRVVWGEDNVARYTDHFNRTQPQNRRNFQLY